VLIFILEIRSRKRQQLQQYLVGIPLGKIRFSERVVVRGMATRITNEMDV
jgi:hypothetical protein